MKHNMNHDNARSKDPELMPVRFEFKHPSAVSVSIAGTFNDWHPSTKSMRSTGIGLWLKEAFLPPGTYEYCLVVDSQWIPDPLARETVPNPFGGRNSILRVAGSPEATHRDDAANVPTSPLTKPKAHRL